MQDKGYPDMLDILHVFILILLFVLLFVAIYYIHSIYVKSHNDATNNVIQKNNASHKNNAKHKNNARHKQKEYFYNISGTGLEYNKYNNILDYLENAEELALSKQTDDIGCYDNDSLIEQAKGIGQTCKSWLTKVTDIFYKKTDSSPIPTDSLGGISPNYFATDDGQLYSFAEICPVTANQNTPLRCLYNQNNQYGVLGGQISNIINDVQSNNGVLLELIDNNITNHKIDTNRLFNTEHVKKYIKYENRFGLNNSSNAVDNLARYSKYVAN